MPRAKLFSEEEVLKRASLYDAFGGKMSLFERAFECYRKSSDEGFRELLESPDAVREALRMMFRKVVEGDMTDPDSKGCLVANTTAELHPHDKQLLSVITLPDEAATMASVDAVLSLLD